MKLKELEIFDDITIQCHDNPDADTIASSYGLYCYFKSKNKNVRMIYSGKNEIQKANIKLMIEKLEIPLEYMKSEIALNYRVKGLLITADCQYGAGNVTRLYAENIAVIDHHLQEIEDCKYMNIISDVGSCSTIVWMMLKEAGFSVDIDYSLSTALYYGLLTDTNNFSEARNPIDRDARDTLVHNETLITQFTNSNISFQELEIAGVAMLRYVFNDEFHFAVVKAQTCDANVLGLISDFILQVDKVHVCVVYNDVDGGYKISVRSCIREVNASELAAFITDKIGSGGGHYRKAGGFISKKLYEKNVGFTNSEAFVNNKMIEYFESFEMIYPSDYRVDISDMKKYQKKNLPMGFVLAKDVLPIGTPITIRTIEGDVDLTIEEDLVIMIGVQGEVYPSRLNKFERAYNIVDKPYVYEECVLKNVYIPTIINRLNGKKMQLTDFAKMCVSTGNVQIYVKRLERAVKVFVDWDMDKYMRGKVGDILAFRTDDLKDMYVVDAEVFDMTYSIVE